MSEKLQVKDNVCLGNISVKGESGVKYVKDELYTDEEVRRAPKGKKHKFTKFDVTVPGFDKGTETELRDLIQRQQIKIKTLEDALAKDEGSDLQHALSEIRELEDEVKRLSAKEPRKP